MFCLTFNKRISLFAGCSLVILVEQFFEFSFDLWRNQRNKKYPFLLKAVAQEEFLTTPSLIEFFKIEMVAAASVCVSLWPFKFYALFSTCI